MSSIQIPNLGAAITLSGSEQLEIVQGGVSVRCTTAQVAQLLLALANTFTANQRVPALGVGTAAALTGGITITSAILLRSAVALTNGAGVATGTLTNAPAAGNPTKWIQVNDNGTVRAIPAW